MCAPFTLIPFSSASPTTRSDPRPALSTENASLRSSTFHTMRFATKWCADEASMTLTQRMVMRTPTYRSLWNREVYRIDKGAGLIGASVGAVLVLFVWHHLVGNNTVSDPGSGRGGGCEGWRSPARRAL